MSLQDLNLHPKLTRKARLRFDRHSGKHWLLYPERGLSLNESAYQIAVLCTGQWSVAEIIGQLQAGAPDVSAGQLSADVQHFLSALHTRGLVEWQDGKSDA